jgi:ketosteroid isomerase-like protein
VNRSFLVALALTVGCGVPHGGNPEPAATVDELFEADRAFARATAESRLDGWMSYFAEDAARLFPGKVVRGLEDIRENDGALFGDETLDLRWDPTDAGLFKDSTHGFTTGRYELIKTAPGDSPAVVGHGTYFSIWRRDASGWKVILDTGSADPPANGPESE